MKTIRNNVFETNSSSMHAIVIPERYFVKPKLSEVVIDLNTDFSIRQLILRNTAAERGAYIMHLIVNHFNTFITHCTDTPFPYKPLDEETKKKNELVFSVFKIWLKDYISYAKKNFNVKLKLINYKFGRTETTFDKKTTYDFYCIKSKNDYAGTGCYGHDAFNAILLNNMFAQIDKAIKQAFETNDVSDIKFIKEKNSWWYGPSESLNFILDDDAVIIQNTDECSETDFKKMKKYIKDYMKQNDYECQVIWPVGG